VAKNKKISRRGVLRTATGAAAGAVAFPYIVPASVLGAGAPSEKITIGCIGLGGMGTGNMNGFLGKREARVVAVCDVDQGHLDRAKRSVDKKYGNSDCATYHDFRDLIARGDIDALSLALPDHWHSIPVVMGARAGKDMYSEKPLARTINEGKAMVEAVHRYDRVWQTGSWQRSVANFHRACELVINGRIGKVSRVEVGLPTGGSSDTKPVQPVPAGVDWDFWLGPAPKVPYRGTLHGNWRWIMDYSGGQLTDWAGHHIDIAHWGLGMDRTGPVEIEGEGVYPNDGKRGGLRASDPKILEEVIGPNETRLYKSRDHSRNFLDCVKTRKETITPIDTAYRSISVAHLGEIAMLLGRKVHWDPAKEQFVNDEAANRLMSRPMRSPWTL